MIRPVPLMLIGNDVGSPDGVVILLTSRVTSLVFVNVQVIVLPVVIAKFVLSTGAPVAFTHWTVVYHPVVVSVTEYPVPVGTVIGPVDAELSVV